MLYTATYLRNAVYSVMLFDVITSGKAEDAIQEWFKANRAQSQYAGMREATLDDAIRKPGFKTVDLFVPSESNPISAKPEHLFFAGYEGTFYVIDKGIHNSTAVYLLESEIYGDDAPALIVNEYGRILADDVRDGLEEGLEELDSEDGE